MKSKPTKTLNRRAFLLSSSVALTGITIIPRNVLGGSGNIAPSDKLTLAYIGCGARGLGELIELVSNSQVQIVAVCDPENYAENYLEFVNKTMVNGIRKALEKPSWGGAIKGCPAKARTFT